MRWFLVAGCLFICMEVFPQFLGGPADGFGTSKTSSVTLNDQAFYCKGGAADGYGALPSGMFILNNQQFYCSGGNGDGFDKSSSPQFSFNNQVFYCSGGNADGFHAAASAMFILNNQVFYCSGGDADGFHAAVSGLFNLNNQLFYCSGGNADGYHAGISPLFTLNNQVFYCAGGNADGYHASVSGLFNLNNQEYYCSGGNGDGFYQLISSPVSLGTGIWQGITSNDWSAVTNWINNTVPDESIDAVIPAGCPYYPVLNGGMLSVNFSSGTYRCRGLLIREGGMVSGTGALMVNGLFMVSGAYTAVNNTNHSQVVGSGGIMTLLPGGLVSLGNQTSTEGTCDLLVTSGGTLSVSGGALYIDDQFNLLSGGTFNMTGGLMVAHRYGIGSDYSASDPGAFYVASGAAGTVTGGIVKVNGKATADGYSAVGIDGAGFSFSGNSLLHIEDGLHASFDETEIRTAGGTSLNNLLVDKPYRTVTIGTDANLLGNVVITPSSGLKINTGVTATVAGDVILLRE